MRRVCLKFFMKNNSLFANLELLSWRCQVVQKKENHNAKYFQQNVEALAYES